METAVRYNRGVCCLNNNKAVPLILAALLFYLSSNSLFVLCNGDGSVPSLTDNDYSCSPGLITPGVTLPRGDIIVEYGNSLEIYCILDPRRTSRNSSSLVFYNNGAVVPFEHVTLVNSTAVRLFIKNPLPSKSMYYCKLRSDPDYNFSDESVCLNSVAIGFKPQGVENFSCVSMNWENLTCTWSLPVNYVKTTTKLYFSLPGKAGAKIFYPCQNNSDVRIHQCFWDSATEVVYRQPYEYYIFRMNISNPFGNITQFFRFSHYAHVIPSKPINYTVVNKTANSIFIQWSVGFPMQNFPPGVLQKVEYQTTWDDKDTWHVVDTKQLNIKAKTHQLNITALKYAHTIYDIRIFMKSPLAVGNEKWSKPAALTIRTLPTVPSFPPKTDVGSFEISRGLPDREVYVYWQQIPEKMYNGDNLVYEVYNVDKYGKESMMYPANKTKAYARFNNLGLRDYMLKVYSVNDEGLSRSGSYIYIPAVTDMVPEPLTFTKIAFESNVYELSWSKPVDDSQIVNYTIFWCDNKMDRPFQCTGYLDWIHVGRDTFIWNVTVPSDKVYQFAISANSHTRSSGMVWASCTVIHDKVIGKMKSVWVSSVGSTYIELGWKLDCSDRVGIVKGFRIYYCQLASPGEKECKGGVQNNIIVMGDPPLTGHGNVTGLKPYTTYMLWIAAVLTTDKDGMVSDVLFNTTLEDAPEPPRNVEVTQVTNTSLVVKWDPPLNRNGVLRYYTVHCYPNALEQVESGLQQVKLMKLQSYYIYNITVTACTGTCSQPAIAPSVRTLAGVPGKVDQPVIDYLNKSQALVTWNPPHQPRGRIDYYEIMLNRLNEHLNSSYINQIIANNATVDMECEIQHEGQSLRYLVYVRAVNIRSEDNTTFKGPWSNAGERSCYNSGSGFPRVVLFIVYFFIVLALITFIFCFGYAARWLWVCCKSITDVHVKLPPELVSPTVEKDNQECHQRMHNWPTDIRKIDSDLNRSLYPTPADQELLLLKKAEGECDGDGDSSGCSSALESVSSSLTSGTHISDSGTEADQRADSPEYIKTSPTTSLRQRNVSSGRDNVRLFDPYVVVGGSDNSQNSCESDPAYTGGYISRGTGYCRVGNASQATPKSGYIGLNLPSTISIPTLTPCGYVSHPPVRSENKDSAPAAPPPAAVQSRPPASKGYVVAGTLPSVQNSAKHQSSSYCRLGTATDYVTLPSTSKDPTGV